MKKARLSAQSRAHLDRRFNEIGAAPRFTAPVSGWIRALRESLGMSAAQLGKRLGITQPSIVAMEQSEARGTIELATLRRTAAALDCTLVYALIPNKPLETIVRDRARLVARRGLSPIEHSMMLEDQAVSGQDAAAAQINEFIQEINPTRLWDEA